ncbi:TPA: flagellin, partial [Campylobacter jejuni]|nr:flagellin [Campylobacter jejuni]
KATQAAQDGQSTKTRTMLQADINRLMEELDNIANTTSFNGKQLLSGGFTNQEFQIGSQSNQTIKASIGPTQSSKIGVTRFETGYNVTASGVASMVIKNYNGLEDFKFQNVVISTSVGTGLGALAEEINRNADKTGVRASFNVQTVGMHSILKGSTSADFSINGVVIGAIDYKQSDENGALIAAINSVKDTTGVEASKDENGKLVLTSRDGRGIKITGSIGTASGIKSTQYENYGRLSLVKNDGRDIDISGTGFGFSAGGGFVSQSSVSLRESKGQIDGQIADAMGFNSVHGGKLIISAASSSINAFMSATGSGFSSGSGYSVGQAGAYSKLLEGNVFVVSGDSKTVVSTAYNVSAGSGFSSNSGQSQFATMKLSTLGVKDETAGVTTLKGAMAVM